MESITVHLIIKNCSEPNVQDVDPLLRVKLSLLLETLTINPVSSVLNAGNNII